MDGQLGLPHALGEPGAGGACAEDPLDGPCHARELSVPVGVRQCREDGFVQTPAEHLDLPAIDEPPHELERVGLLRLQPLEQRPGVVEPDPHARVTVEGVEHRAVREAVVVLEDEPEVADRLMVVEDEREVDARHAHGGPC